MRRVDVESWCGELVWRVEEKRVRGEWRMREEEESGGGDRKRRGRKRVEEESEGGE